MDALGLKKKSLHSRDRDGHHLSQLSPQLTLCLDASLFAAPESLAQETFVLAIPSAEMLCLSLLSLLECDLPEKPSPLPNLRWPSHCSLPMQPCCHIFIAVITLRHLYYISAFIASFPLLVHVLSGGRAFAFCVYFLVSSARSLNKY